MTALHHSAELGHFSIIEVFRDFKLNFNQLSGDSDIPRAPIHYSVMNNRVKCFIEMTKVEGIDLMV